MRFFFFFFFFFFFSFFFFVGLRSIYSTENCYTILLYQIQLSALYFVEKLSEQFCKYAIVLEVIFVKSFDHVISSVFQLLLKNRRVRRASKTRRAPFDLTEAEGMHCFDPEVCPKSSWTTFKIILLFGFSWNLTECYFEVSQGLRHI